MQDKETENENGRSMIEMLGVLAIIGVLSVGGIAGYSKAMMRYRTNKAIEQITQIAGNVRAFFAPQKSYDGLCEGCNALLKKARIVPEEMWEDTSIINPFGGSVAIGNTCKYDDDNGCHGEHQAFYMVYRDIPTEACIEIVTQDWSALDLKVIHIDTGTYMDGPDDLGGYFNYKTPVDINFATEACSYTQHGEAGLLLYFDVDITKGYWVTDGFDND